MKDLNIPEDLKTLIIKERSLKAKWDEIEPRIVSLNKAIDEAESKFSWKESIFSGFLGGNRELVRSVDSLNGELDPLEKQAKQIEPQLKKIEKSVKAELSKLVSPLNSDFESNLQEKERWLKLEKKSKAYKELVLKAEQGIKDALTFISWDRLLKHPDAQSKLDEFKKGTAVYQKAISSLEEEIKTLQGEVVVFEELIKFSSQKVAMNSFRTLVKKSNDYYKMAYDQVELYLAKNNDILEKIKSEVN